MPHDPASPGIPTQHDPVVAVFDTKTVALRTIVELAAAEFNDIWLGVVRGETDDGETTVACEGGGETPLHRVLAERGSSDALAHRFDGILPPGSAVMSLRAPTKVDHAIDIIEVTGGHIEHI